MRLSGVLEHRHAKIRDRCRTPVEVHRDHGAGAVGDRSRGRLGIDRCGVGIDVGEPRDRAGRAHRGGGGHGGERGNDHLVSGTDAERNEREPQGVGARRHRDGVAPADERRELGLERFGLRPEEIAPGSHDARDRLRQLGLERRSPPSEVDDRDPGGGGHTYHERRER